VEEVNKNLSEKQEPELTGCSVMTDAMTVTKGRVMILWCTSLILCAFVNQLTSQLRTNIVKMFSTWSIGASSVEFDKTRFGSVLY
jgi:ABC-type thiamine transport system substrate-binding protein